MYFALVLFLLFIIELGYFRLADKFNIIDRPNERSSHTQITLRGGGVIFYFGVLLFFLFSKGVYPWFFAGLTLITGISFIDDIKSVSQGVRLIIHFTALLFLFYGLGLFALPIWGVLLLLIVATGVINAYNFMDGINGITGGYSLVLLLGLTYVNTVVETFVHPYLLYAMLAAVMVFNFFNFRVKARCFAGDVGSVGMAFILLFLIGRLMWVTQDLSWILFLVVYGVDSVLTIIHRLLLKENIGLPHRKHAYQIMANELGRSHVGVSLFYMVLQGGLIVGFLAIPSVYRWSYVLGSILLLSLAYILFMKKYFKLHQQ